MSEKASNKGLSMNEEERVKANKDIVKHLQDTMRDGRRELGGLRARLSLTYGVIVILSIIMFFLGVVLLSVPIVAAFGGKVKTLQSLIAAGFGFADLTALFFFRPIERIHRLMGDLGQITLAINSFQTQVGLFLLEMNKDDRKTIGEAAGKIKEAAKDSIKLIQDYFEAIGTGE